jgi:predicted nucleotidyltransferase/uncharacterized protein (UPF0332 family)
LVDIKFEYRKRPVEYHHDEAYVKLATKFSDTLKKELKDFLKAVILFGSTVRGDNTKGSDIDILIILNDMTVVLSNEVLTSIRVIIENTAAKVSGDFHINTMHLSEVWDYARLGDPIVVNILREGLAVYDEGFFQPMQLLLDTGKIRPTKEAVWAYYLRAPKTLKNAKHHLQQSVVDMYWAVIDASHAALMHIDVVPGAPHKVADLLEEHFVKAKLLDIKYVRMVRKFYKLAKDIGHQTKLSSTGKEVDALLIEATDIVKRMKLLINIDKLELLDSMKR